MAAPRGSPRKRAKHTVWTACCSVTAWCLSPKSSGTLGPETPGRRRAEASDDLGALNEEGHAEIESTTPTMSCARLILEVAQHGEDSPIASWWERGRQSVELNGRLSGRRADHERGQEGKCGRRRPGPDDAPFSPRTPSDRTAGLGRLYAASVGRMSISMR